MVITALCAAIPFTAHALPLETYAASSVLASGNWAKISIEKTGIYSISNASLKKMGFSDPAKVNIYGYGGKRLPDTFTGYIDDLPAMQCIHTSRGIIFYGVGPTSYASISGSNKRHSNNPFTTEGYYFLSDREATAREIPVDGGTDIASPATSFTEVIFHEKDLVSLGQTGHELLGEDFLYSSKRTFNFSLPGLMPDSKIWMECAMAALSRSARTYIGFTVNGEALPIDSSDNIEFSSDSHEYYIEKRLTKTFQLDGQSLALGINVSNSGTLTAANLNYILLNYTRSLSLGSSSSLAFSILRSCGTLSDAKSSTRVWDVTDPLDITEMKGSLEGSQFSWRSPFNAGRDYIAFNDDASFPEPTFVGKVANQDLHSSEVPDMVIFTASTWADQARRLARHRAESLDSLKVLVVDQELVFNEFASGSHDVNAFRKFLKMLYDRGQASGSERSLRYALFFGRGTFDNRRMTEAIKSLRYPLMPIWQSDSGGNDTGSYTTDDIFAFLSDSNFSFGSQPYSIAVGRLPVTSQLNAKEAVDKIIEYETSMPNSDWRNRILMIADDADGGAHMMQNQTMHSEMLKSNGGSDIYYYKLYPDQYELQGGQYPKAREVMFRKLDEGVAWWTFIGHANTTSWTHEKLLTYSDISNLYLKHYPIVYAACCDFLRWDSKNISAAEIMWGLKSGGAIAIISAVRPSYISENGDLSAKMGQFMVARDENGRRMTVGEIIRRAKGDLIPDTNKLRYVLIGDPSMYPIVPDNRVVISSINGIEPDNPEEDAILMARQKAVMEGYVADIHGNPLDNFTGIISSTVYDAEYSVTTLGHEYKQSPGYEMTFDQQGDRIFAGNDSIRNGHFKVNIAMPSSISGNYRPAAVNLFAKSAERNSPATASGMERRFYVFGEDFTAVDSLAPEIRTIYLNHPDFRNGERVNASPMLIAEIADDSGINISTSGVGHQMSLLLDNKTNYSDVSDYFTPSATEPGTATIAYPLSDLTPGIHTLRFRIWDTSDNSASKEISFLVDPDRAPIIYDIYSDANPASTHANFYLSHDRPDANIEVKFTIYNMIGKPIWTYSATGRSDMFLSFPIQWNLCDTSGSRVGRGIYLYRAVITADGVESATAVKRIAVTGN